MNSISQTKCALIFDKAISTPLGTEVINFFLKEAPGINDSSFILNIRDKLDLNEYSSPQDFLNDVKAKFSAKARDFNSESDISLSLLTILQDITERFEEYFPAKEKKLNVDNFNKIFAEFKHFGEHCPDDRESFISFYKSAMEAAKIPPRASDFKDMKVIEEHYNIKELYDNIMKLETDKDREKVVDIIISHEPDYLHFNNMIEIDLTKCASYTLKLIKQFVDKRLHDENID